MSNKKSGGTVRGQASHKRLPNGTPVQGANPTNPTLPLTHAAQHPPGQADNARNRYYS